MLVHEGYRSPRTSPGEPTERSGMRRVSLGAVERRRTKVEVVGERTDAERVGTALAFLPTALRRAA